MAKRKVKVKKKPTAAQRQLDAEWKSILAKHSAPLERGAQAKGVDVKSLAKVTAKLAKARAKIKATDAKVKLVKTNGPGGKLTHSVSVTCDVAKSGVLKGTLPVKKAMLAKPVETDDEKFKRQFDKQKSISLSRAKAIKLGTFVEIKWRDAPNQVVLVVGKSGYRPTQFDMMVLPLGGVINDSVTSDQIVSVLDTIKWPVRPTRK